ncbi:MAG: phosphonate metabolism protein [Rhodobacteraceae bacterium]|nr:MAG: phosphonate metabolism protein [Paracoccaceae bacterium]
MSFTRYALYYAPPADTGWTRFATSWLGWDMQAGKMRDHPTLPDLPLAIGEITAAPRKYGLHATIKPPFHLAPGTSRATLENACAELCQTQPAFPLGPLRLTPLGRFLALCPPASPVLSEFAARCVRDLDRFRAPLTPDQLTRRRAARLSPRQEANLTAWGYPYVLDDFRFHITLTGRIAKPDLPGVQHVLEQALIPLIPPGLSFGDLTLTGEDENGQFHLLRRFPLQG